MNHISALKKSAAAIALVLGVTPMGAHALLSDAKMIAHWPLNETNNPETGKTPDAMKKCPGTVASGVTFTPAPTGVDATAVQPWTEYEAIPAPPDLWMPFPRYTQAAIIGTNADGAKNITVQDKSPATCVGIATMDIAPAYSISAWVKTDSDAPSGATVIERGTSWQLTVGPAEDVDPTPDMTPLGGFVTPDPTEPVTYEYTTNTNPYALHKSGRYYKQPVSFCAKGAATEYPTPTTPTTLAVAKTSGVQKCLKGYMSTPYQPQYGTQSGYNGKAGYWHNIIVTYAKAPPVVSGATQPQAKLYIDGVLVAASERPDPIRKHTAPFPQPEKGTMTTIGKRFQGKLDDIRLYNIALLPDDITELAYGCRPATFDPKTGKVSIPCVVEGTTASQSYYYLSNNGEDYDYLNSYNVGAWTADLLALPPVKVPSSAVGGERGRNLVFNVAAAKLLPVPVGALPAMPAGYRMDGRWYPSEYPWGVFVARYSSIGEALMDEDIYRWEEVTWSNANDYDLADAILQIPAVTVPSPLGLPVKDCYSAMLYYSVNYNRFYMSYTDVDSRGANCGIGTPGSGSNYYGIYGEE